MSLLSTQQTDASLIEILGDLSPPKQAATTTSTMTKGGTSKLEPRFYNRPRTRQRHHKMPIAITKQ